ncbi:MAG: phosphoribosylformylglycinamidine synthase subunit PurL [Candidatus Ancillula sp.]|jgi:phosphoribosylformylglycinamidine synthase|nr:phosphoribosylformylglycinamidine synthase subunit PurL [Candidatus Ancillula sp.]
MVEQKRVRVLDTVDLAKSTPDKPQDFEALGLRVEEYEQIKVILGRRPSDSELAMYSVMWSEHCSYKSSKFHLRKFGEKMTPKMEENLLVGMGENAGVVDIGDGWAVTFKVESHNHPSFVEPFQGAATGVGGIVRDIMAMGAKPIAVMDQLRFGNLNHPDSKRVIPQVVAGIAHYGNCLGLPNIGGEVEFDPSFQGNPLVNALCLGALRHEDLHLSGAKGDGNAVILFGARTGGDGIGGASILASDTFEEGGPAKRPSVQVGDPFMEKVLIECCLEMFSEEVIDGLQDLGAAGISCATSEMAAMGDGGMHINLDRVLLRDPSLTPEEILMSESQERMMASVRQDRLAEFITIANRWDVEYAIIGEVNNSGRLTIDHKGLRLVDIDPATAAVDSPVYKRPYSRPIWQDYLNSHTVQIDDLDKAKSPAALEQHVLKVLSHPNVASKEWITSQYDHFVQGNTALAMPDDAGVVRIDSKTGLGVALSTDANSRFAKLDPREGAKISLAESFINVSCTGAKPLAVTDCLNFGNPEHRDTMWQLVEAIEGLADACLELELPVTGGNVSLYNVTGTPKNQDESGINGSINPTPVVGVLGKINDVSRATPSGFVAEGHSIYLLGHTLPELDGSIWAAAIHDHLGGVPPVVFWPQIRALSYALIDMSRVGFVSTAHDVSQGGLITTLFESCFRRGIGCKVDLTPLKMRDKIDDTDALFSESLGRAVVAIDPKNEKFMTLICKQYSVPFLKIGVTSGVGDDASLEVDGLFDIELDRAKSRWGSVIPDAMN